MTDRYYFTSVVCGGPDRLVVVRYISSGNLYGKYIIVYPLKFIPLLMIRGKL